MTLVEKMAGAMAVQYGWPAPDYMVMRDDLDHSFPAWKLYIASALAALEEIKPTEDMIEKIAGEMDVVMQMEFNAVFAPDVMKRMARAACFALVNEAILQQKQ